MNKHVKSISDILKKDKAFDKMRRVVKNYDLVDEFVEIFPELKKVVKAVKVDKDVLFLSAENSVWRSELNFRQKFLVDKINHHYREKRIKKIKFVP